MEAETLKRKGGANAEGADKNEVHSIFKQRCVVARICDGYVQSQVKELLLIVLASFAGRRRKSLILQTR